MFTARWTEQIHEEWIRNLSKNRPEITDKLHRTKQLMNEAIPDSLVTGYESMIENLALPDPNDRHILAAAIRSGSQAIITFNLKDFPADALETYAIEAIHPDAFIDYQLELNLSTVINTAQLHRQSLKSPPKSAEDYLETLAAQGLIVTASKLKDYINFI